MRTSDRPTLQERLGRLLQDKRQLRGETQEQVAERANLSPKYLGEVERGEANVTIAAVARLANALDWDPWPLFDGGTQPAVNAILVEELDGLGKKLRRMLRWVRSVNATAASGSPSHPVGSNRRRP